MENVNTINPTPAIEAEVKAQNEATAEETKTTGSKPSKKTATPKKKTRDVAELINAAIKGMSDKEKEKLITYLKSEMLGMENKLVAMKNNCEQAYEKCRRLEEEYVAMERYYKERLGFIDQQVTAFGNAVRLSIVGGLN